MTHFHPSTGAAFLLPYLAAGLFALPARADWRAIQEAAPGPIRSIARRADGKLLGVRSSGRQMDAFLSATDGASWAPHGAVVRKDDTAFGDGMVLAVPGTNTVFCTYREIAGGQHRVSVSRSDDGGDTWAFDSTVTGPHARFVGAPFLFLAPNGDLQCYYDSEPMAAENGQPGHQWIAMQGRSGLTGPWDRYGVVTASRENNPATLTRDGMPSVVSLGGERLMLVTEGVETQGHGGANVIRTIQSWDGGRTWDFANRAIAYQARIDPGTNRGYNAYCPWAIRVGGGPVWVAFCTDEDYDGPPDFSHQPVHERHAHVKLIRTLDTFERWSPPEPVWTATFRNYAPGLFERRHNNVLASVDRLSGLNAYLTHVPAFGVSDAVRALYLGAGRAPASSADMSRLNVVMSGSSATVIDLRDAVRILRVATRLEPG